jgi:hypothetical protein
MHIDTIVAQEIWAGLQDACAVKMLVPSGLSKTDLLDDDLDRGY